MNEPAKLDDVIPATTLGLSRLGWVKPADHVTFDQWVGILDAAFAVKMASPWWIGDLINYAVAQGKDFEERAIQALPLAKTTAINYAIVARVFQHKERRSGLTLQHHAAVIRLARKDMSAAQIYLDTAESLDWSVSSLREALRPANGEALSAQIPTQTENPPQDTDWRDALLDEAVNVIEAAATDCLSDPQMVRTLAVDWLTRYEAHRAR